MTPFEKRQKVEEQYFNKHGKRPETPAELQQAVNEYYIAEDSAKFDNLVEDVKKTEQSQSDAEKEAMKRLAAGMI